MNRLANTRSPYLLQHAGNPVDWYVWGDEAFARARAEDRPIFLSIGYSTCHWCHVMERESFENDEIAAVLNDYFVSIKVDREERPDVDRVYMTFVQATTGSGGWPMSVWLTPDLKPFYGGTYFPPTARWGRPGFLQILEEIARVWQADRGKVQASADGLASELRRATAAAVSSAGIPQADALARIVRQFADMFDARFGGFGGAPKFPRPSELLFLLREFARTADAGARNMVLATLHAMALGGMRDHIGGGFHRYSVDEAWRVPHFEKMLYDQAQLALAYLEGAQVSGSRQYLEVAEDTLRYVMRQMTAAEGGFFSAEDADSVPPDHAGEAGAHKSEGAFYLWKSDEIDTLLGGDAGLIKARFGIEPAGNAPSDPQQEFTGKNILYIAKSIEDLANEAGRSPSDIVRTLERARLEMFRARLDRPRPHLDDKVLTAWNGLMIAAFARAARVVAAFDDDSQAGKSYLESAVNAARFLQTTMWNEETRTLLRRFRDGHAEIDAYAEDYAFLIYGLIELFQADPQPEWLSWAVELQHRQDDLFWDDDQGGWFSTTGRDPSVLLRLKEDYDGAEPSASSVAVCNLLVLSHLAEDMQWTDRIERTLRLFATRLDQMGRSVPMMAAALSTYVAGPQQAFIVGPRGDESLLRALSAKYVPFTTILRLLPDQQSALEDLLPLVASMRAADNKPTLFLCRNFTCRRPMTTVEELERELTS